MRVDTDVLIWNLRGNARAAYRLDGMSGFLVSAVTCMELVQGVRDKGELHALRRALNFGSVGPAKKFRHPRKPSSSEACSISAATGAITNK